MQLTQSTPHRHSGAPEMFSSQVMLALSSLSSQFGGEINDAFETMPATEERAKENLSLKEDPEAAVDKLKQLRDNKLAISGDMRILHQAKVLGNSAQFKGFLHLGKDDYLDSTTTLEVGDSDDESDEDSSSDSDESEDDDSDDCSEDDDEESDMSEYDDSEYDSDDSSLGSIGGLMTEMENNMGVVIPEDLKVKVTKSKGLTSVLRGSLYWDDSNVSHVSMDS